MNRYFLSLAVAAFSLPMVAAENPATNVVTVFDAENPATNVVTVFDAAVFYDGYQPEIRDAGKEDGILRHSNYQYGKRLTDGELDMIGDNLCLDIYIDALCDNYDRMGRVSLALVPKGADTYQYDDVDRIELARFITPFMNKNRTPNRVPYHYEIPEATYIFRSSDLRSRYDLWLETEVFGIPYAANTQVAGCADRDDVFAATVTLSSTPFTGDAIASGTSLYPLYHSKCEIHGDVNFNSFKEGANDEIGKASRTYRFTTTEDYSDARLYFIMTNHGAAENGEEYERRVHFVYVDDELAMTYTPGGVSCEPYRQYNTVGNYIYMFEPQPDEYWEEWNNWCPGQAVPIRNVHLGALKAGEHSVCISVPDAVFYNDLGDFRPSLYVQALKEGALPGADVDMVTETISGSWRQENGVYYFDTESELYDGRIYRPDGTLLYGTHRPTEGIDANGYSGPLLIVVTGERGIRSLTVNRK